MMSHENDKHSKWKKLAQEVKNIEGNENISDEMAERVVDFLREIAELEIKMIEDGLLNHT